MHLQLILEEAGKVLVGVVPVRHGRLAERWPSHMPRKLHSKKEVALLRVTQAETGMEDEDLYLA